MTLYSCYLIFLAILPAILIGTFVYSKDKNKEPLTTLILLFCTGIVSALVVIAISQGLDILFPTLSQPHNEIPILAYVTKIFLEIAFLEEACKWIIVYFLGYKNKEFDETYDIIIYSIIVSLGFASTENILYVLETGSVLTALLRAVLSIPAHTSFAIFMSYYLCYAKLEKLQNKKKNYNMLKSILIPVGLHGIYDFCLFTSNEWFFFLFILFVITLFFNAFMRLKEAYTKNASLITKK